MKKYILLISLFCFAYLQAEATIPKDTVIDMGKVKIRIPKGHVKDIDTYSFQFDSGKWADIQKDFEMNSDRMLAMQKNLKESLKDIPDMKDFNFQIYNFKDGKEDKQKATPRIEKKTFTNISEIEFFHKYGDIMIRESGSKNIELEIQYFDKGNNKGVANTSTTGKLLSIVTEKSSKNAKINYIISIPKNTALNIDLKYGNVKMDKHEGALVADLSYGNLSAQSISKSKPVFNLKYSDLKIDDIEDVTINASYSDVKITKARDIQTKGMYTDYKIGTAGSFATTGSSMYGDINISTVTSITTDSKYSDIVIGNLVSDMTAKTTYGDITIKAISSKTKSIDVSATYSDLVLSVPENTNVAFDAELTYGDVSISKKYSVKYTENKETNIKTVKVGQIGTGTPKTQIKVRNVYGDLQIR